VQLRFWHFFLVPIVFLVGNVELSHWRLAIILLMALGYSLKYSAVNDLLLDQRSVLVKDSQGGRILSSTGFPDGPGYPCGKDCGVRFPEGTKVGFSAKPDLGYRFDHWLDGCAGQKGDCMLHLNSNQSVSAVFVPIETIRIELKGEGRVRVSFSGTAILCRPTCNYSFDRNTRLELHAQSFNGHRWLEWTGSCLGQPNPCHLNMNTAHEVGARFITVHKVTVIPAEGGHVVWEAADRQSCPGACEKTVDAGSQVRFKAEPVAGYRFDRWALGCSGKLPDCEITVDSSSEVSARFVPVTDGGAD
jgi:hypothetical protein